MKRFITCFKVTSLAHIKLIQSHPSPVIFPLVKGKQIYFKSLLSSAPTCITTIHFHSSPDKEILVFSPPWSSPVCIDRQKANVLNATKSTFYRVQSLPKLCHQKKSRVNNIFPEKSECNSTLACAYRIKLSYTTRIKIETSNNI